MSNIAVNFACPDISGVIISVDSGGSFTKFCVASFAASGTGGENN